MIDHRANKMIDQAETLITAKRFKSAIPILEDVAENSTDPALRMLVSYNLGSINWAQLCDGCQGRRWFQAVVELSPEVSGFKPGLKERMTANACENMMLLSLSFDEYEQWAARVAKLQPENHILHHQLPEFRRLRERGHPWSVALRVISEGYYTRNDPAQDRGRYGEAASTFHLLLCNRKSMRIAREDWRLILYEYGTLSMRVFGDYLLRLNGRDPHEYLFILLNAMPHVEEYMKRYPADRVIDGLYANMRKVASQIEQAASSATAPYRVPTAPFPGRGPEAAKPIVDARRLPVVLMSTIVTSLVFFFCCIGPAGFHLNFKAHDQELSAWDRFRYGVVASALGPCLAVAFCFAVLACKLTRSRAFIGPSLSIIGIVVGALHGWWMFELTETWGLAPEVWASAPLRISIGAGIGLVMAWVIHLYVVERPQPISASEMKELEGLLKGIRKG